MVFILIMFSYLCMLENSNFELFPCYLPKDTFLIKKVIGETVLQLFLRPENKLHRLFMLHSNMISLENKHVAANTFQ